MIDHFAGCTTEAEVSARYRALIKEHHPDRPHVRDGGEAMRQVNAQHAGAIARARRAQAGGREPRQRQGRPESGDIPSWAWAYYGADYGGFTEAERAEAEARAAQQMMAAITQMAAHLAMLGDAAAQCSSAIASAFAAMSAWGDMSPEDVADMAAKARAQDEADLAAAEARLFESLKESP